jgi:hypothetical protein
VAQTPLPAISADRNVRHALSEPWKKIIAAMLWISSHWGLSGTAQLFALK